MQLYTVEKISYKNAGILYSDIDSFFWKSETQLTVQVEPADVQSVPENFCRYPSNGLL